MKFNFLTKYNFSIVRVNLTQLFQVLLISYLLVFNINISLSQSLNLTFGQSATQLINNHLLGTGVSATNITGQLGSNSYASFNNNGVQGFPFTSGIILSTGSLTQIDSLSTFLMSTDLLLPGDSILNSISSPLLTHDAQTLNFDFLATADTLEMEIIFSSEEYNENVNTSFADLFGIFITGPGYSPATNVAYLPNTNTPISINTINNGGPYSGISMGPCLRCSYYIDNVIIPQPVLLAPDGFTTAIKFYFKVQPCEQYNIKITIADVNDGLYDTQIYFKQGSFTPYKYPKIMLNNIYYAPDTIVLCDGNNITLTVPDGANINWSTGDTTNSIIVSQPGTYSAYYSNSTCFYNPPSITVIEEDTIPVTISASGSTTFCQGDSTVLTATGVAQSYYWYKDGKILSWSNNSPTMTVKKQGNYYCIAYTSWCIDTSNTISINVPCVPPRPKGNSPLKELFEQNNLEVYPNPGGGIFTLKSPHGTLYIYNMVGDELYTQVLNTMQTMLDLSNVPNGLYHVKVDTGNRILHTKIMISKL
jgi:Secretion system C-terminal sorting domain